jgi:hypothetical protein
MTMDYRELRSKNRVESSHRTDEEFGKRCNTVWGQHPLGPIRGQACASVGMMI